MSVPKMILLSFIALFSFSVLAEDSMSIDDLTEIDSETYNQNPRLYRAEGQHQCQSDRSLGHTCQILGVNFTDCNQAHFKLKQEDCCSGSRFGGNSIGFKLTKCTNFN